MVHLSYLGYSPWYTLHGPQGGIYPGISHGPQGGIYPGISLLCLPVHHGGYTSPYHASQYTTLGIPHSTLPSCTTLLYWPVCQLRDDGALGSRRRFTLGRRRREPPFPL